MNKDLIFDKFYCLDGEFNCNLDIFLNNKNKIYLKNISNGKEAEIKDKDVIDYNLKNDIDFINFINNFSKKYLI